MPEPDTEPKTHYQRLGIKPTASAQQIRRAYRDLSKLYHPDTTDLPADVATEKFQLLNEAYATLSSPERRWAYDQQMGYSRISVIRPPEDLNTPVSQRREYRSSAYLDPNDRPLSAGEIFALFILGVTFVACLVLVLTIGLTQGETALATPGVESPTATEQAISAPHTATSNSGQPGAEAFFNVPTAPAPDLPTAPSMPPSPEPTSEIDQVQPSSSQRPTSPATLVLKFI